MTKWNLFFKEKITKIFTEKNLIIDIGGALRISSEKGNRYNHKRSWIIPLAEKKDLKILDPTPKYNPDIVGDIHNLPFEKESIDAIICIAVLEHVNNPIKASQEMQRVLKKGGYCFIYVPFLYYYHAEEKYYKDYWRFTKDSLYDMFKNFSKIEIQNVRGATETWLHISPIGKIKIFVLLARLIDKISKKTNSKQTSGYYIFLVK